MLWLGEINTRLKREREKIIVSIFQCVTWCLFIRASKVACDVLTTLKSRMNINRNIQREEKQRWSLSLLPTQSCSMYVQFVYMTMLMRVFVNIMFALAREATEAAHHDTKEFVSSLIYILYISLAFQYCNFLLFIHQHTCQHQFLLRSLIVKLYRFSTSFMPSQCGFNVKKNIPEPLFQFASIQRNPLIYWWKGLQMTNLPKAG